MADLMTKALDPRRHELMAMLPMTLHTARGEAGPAAASSSGRVFTVIAAARHVDDVMIIGHW